MARPTIGERARSALRRFRGATPDASRQESDATEADVRACYRLFLGRAPDPVGWRTYASQVRDGMALDDLVRCFVLSPEYRERHRLLDPPSEGLPRPVEVEGFTLYVRSDDWTVGGAIVEHGVYEPDVTAAVREALAPGMTFVDVGASIGYYTVLGGRAVGSRGRVVAFEPGPQNRTPLLLNVAVNSLDHVEVYEVALGDVPGVLVYDRMGGNGIVGDFDGGVSALGVHELVRSVALDDVLGGAGRVDAMKVDVEGAEWRVLKGGEGVLARHRPVLFVEFSPPALHNVSGVEGAELLEFLAGFGYRFTVLPTGAQRQRLECGQDFDAVLAAYEVAEASHVDLVARAG